jgi:hypothetical protein
LPQNPLFDIDENALPIGAAILAETTRRFLKGELELLVRKNKILTGP